MWLRTRLWFRPALAAVVSVLLLMSAKLADTLLPKGATPELRIESVERLLSVLSSSLLAVSTFSVAALVSAYASVSSSTTPRSFNLVLKDDKTQNTLSVYVGALIFSVIGLVVIESRYFGPQATFVLFVISALVFALVIGYFVRWIDSIARLGRMGNTISRAHHETLNAVKQLAKNPRMGAAALTPLEGEFLGILPERSGYLTRVNVAALSSYAKKHGLLIQVMAYPGQYLRCNEYVAKVQTLNGALPPKLKNFKAKDWICVESEREFDYNPLYGVHMLSEIACIALSPAVNDHGTAIQVTRVQEELLMQWVLCSASTTAKVDYEQVQLSRMDPCMLVKAAFDPIGRDGADNMDVIKVIVTALENLIETQATELSAELVTMAHRLKERVAAEQHLTSELQQFCERVDRLSQRAKDLN